MVKLKPTVSVRTLTAGQNVRLKTGQRAQLAEDIVAASTFVRVYPYNLASRQRSNSAVPVPLDYIVLLEPDVKVTHNDVTGAPVSQ